MFIICCFYYKQSPWIYHTTLVQCDKYRKLKMIFLLALYCISNPFILFSTHIFLLQFQFLFMSVVTDVQVQGRKSSYLHFVKSYRLEYSVDCSTFTPVLGETETSMVCVFLMFALGWVLTWRRHSIFSENAKLK